MAQSQLLVPVSSAPIIRDSVQEDALVQDYKIIVEIIKDLKATIMSLNKRLEAREILILTFNQLITSNLPRTLGKKILITPSIIFD